MFPRTSGNASGSGGSSRATSKAPSSTGAASTRSTAVAGAPATNGAAGAAPGPASARAPKPAKAAREARQKVRDAAAAREAKAAPADATLDIELADAEGHLFAGRSYRVVDAAGQLFAGQLDANGAASLSGLARGPAVVTFEAAVPGGEDWSALAGPPAPPADASLAGGRVDLEVVSDDGTPLAHRRFVLVDARDRRHEGTLDAAGRARVEKLPEGQVQVSFPT